MVLVTIRGVTCVGLCGLSALEPTASNEDVDNADLRGVSDTPTSLINGRRHYGAYDIATLSAAMRASGARARLLRP
jgi:hypothetical protein